MCLGPLSCLPHLLVSLSPSIDGLLQKKALLMVTSSSELTPSQVLRLCAFLSNDSSSLGKNTERPHLEHISTLRSRGQDA